MKGLILAAGKGARLNGTLGDKPKCLMRLGGRTLIERQIESLRSVGIEDIVVVVGCQAEDVCRTCGPRVAYVENARYAQTNSLYSLWLARPMLLDGCLIVNCDVLFHPQMLVDLVTARHEDALLISYDDGPLGDEEMKIKARRGRVIEISKTLDPGEADGENVGIVKFGRGGAALLADLLEKRVATGALRDWAPRAFADFAQLRPLHAIGTRGYPWTEIDFPEDYQRALAEVLPAIQADVTVRLDPDTTIHVRSIRAQPEAIDGSLRPAAGE